MEKLSRRTLARYVANHTSNGVVPESVVSQVAAYLIDTGRSRESQLVARAIEDELAARGAVIADVTTAYRLSHQEKSKIRTVIDAGTVYFRETVDPGVIGGVRVDTPGKTLDATIATKLQALKRAKL